MKIMVPVLTAPTHCSNGDFCHFRGKRIQNQHTKQIYFGHINDKFTQKNCDRYSIGNGHEKSKYKIPRTYKVATTKIIKYEKENNKNTNKWQ